MQTKVALGNKGGFTIAFYFFVLVNIRMINVKHLFEKQQLVNY